MSEVGGHADAVRSLVEALNDRDVDQARALCAETVVLEPLSTDRAERKPYVGHDGLGHYFADLAATWALLRIQPKEVREQGRYVVMVGIIRARSLDGSFESEGEVGLVFRMTHDLVDGIKVYASGDDALALIA